MSEGQERAAQEQRIAELRHKIQAQEGLLAEWRELLIEAEYHLGVSDGRNERQAR